MRYAAVVGASVAVVGTLVFARDGDRWLLLHDQNTPH